MKICVCSIQTNYSLRFLRNSLENFQTLPLVTFFVLIAVFFILKHSYWLSVSFQRSYWLMTSCCQRSNWSIYFLQLFLYVIAFYLAISFLPTLLLANDCTLPAFWLVNIFQYKVGQLFMIAKHSMEQSQKGEGVEVVENKPHEVNIRF